MMSKGKIFQILFLTLVAVAVVSCNRTEIVSFNLAASLEQPNDPERDTTTQQKSYLTNGEQWIYWEEGDDIRFYDESPTGQVMTLKGTANTNSRVSFSGSAEVPTGGNYNLYAIYPAASGYAGQGKPSQLNYPSTQPYRTTDDPAANGARSDLSFGRGCFPMVAWTNTSSWTAVSSDGATLGETAGSLDFHSVSGLLRFHFFSTVATSWSEEARTISSITFEEVSSSPKQIAGKFNIIDLATNAPYLQGVENTPDNRKITISGINRQLGDSLWTFYLALPAVGSSATERTTYKLKVTVINAEGKEFVKTMSGAVVGRNRITKMQAIDITEWKTSTGADGVCVVGVGTKDRPFQIYDISDLKYIRDCFASPDGSGRVYVNGLEVGNWTHFQISRNDIVLDPTNWTAPIRAFKGHIKVANNAVQNIGITNISGYPIFDSVAPGAMVEFVTIKNPPAVKPATCGMTNEAYAEKVYLPEGATEITYFHTGTTSFSPLCRANAGSIKDCQNHMNIAFTTYSVGSSLAGLCIDNYGVISGGANEGVLVCGRRMPRTIGSATVYQWQPFSTPRMHIAGVCLTNHRNATVQGFTFTTAALYADSVAGICFTNLGTVKNCQGAFRIYQSPSTWGGIVFYNDTCRYTEPQALIENCDITSFIWTDTTYENNQPVTTNSIGGISYRNRGVINHCRNNANLRGRHSGGIAVRQDGKYAEIRNCWSSAIATVRGYNEVGGIVARLWRGRVVNCYCRSNMKRTIETSGTVRGAEGGIAGEVNEEAVIINCYNRFSSFYGNFIRTINEGVGGETEVEYFDNVHHTRTADSRNWYTMTGAAYKHYEQEFTMKTGTFTVAGNTFTGRAAIIIRDNAGNLLPTVNQTQALVDALNATRPDDSKYDTWYVATYENYIDGTPVVTYDTIPRLECQRSNNWIYNDLKSVRSK